MVLGIVLKSDGSGKEAAAGGNSQTPYAYNLQATEIQISVSRSPMQSPLPGGDPLLLDLGQVRPVIKVSGVINSTSGTDGANVIPSKRQLEDFAEEAYISNLTVEITVGSITDRYTHKIQALTFSLPAAREDLWDFTLTLACLRRVNV